MDRGVEMDLDATPITSPSSPPAVATNARDMEVDAPTNPMPSALCVPSADPRARSPSLSTPLSALQLQESSTSSIPPIAIEDGVHPPNHEPNGASRGAPQGSIPPALLAHDSNPCPGLSETVLQDSRDASDAPIPPAIVQAPVPQTNQGELEPAIPEPEGEPEPELERKITNKKKPQALGLGTTL